MNLRQPKEALRELEILKDIAPDEANVHFMLGRLYKMMRDRTAAIRHFTIALNLDPKVRLDPSTFGGVETDDTGVTGCAVYQRGDGVVGRRR